MERGEGWEFYDQLINSFPTPFTVSIFEISSRSFSHNFSLIVPVYVHMCKLFDL